MMVSTRGRYALRVMIDLAEHSLTDKDRYIPMKEVAGRQDISLKYLEKILPALAKNNFIEGVHGKGGGYRLTKKPSDYRVSDILKLTEGELLTVACLDCHAKACSRINSCRTRPLWTKLQEVVYTYLDSVTVEDLMQSDADKEAFLKSEQENEQ